jgi:hypothetical protein
MIKYTEKKEKRVGIEIYEYKGKVQDYIREMLLEIGFIIEKNTRGYLRVSMDGIGEIVVHGNNSNDGMYCVNIYLPGLRKILVQVFSGREKGYVSYIYEFEKKEKERGSVTIREFTDRILEEIRDLWESKKCIQK